MDRVEPIRGGRRALAAVLFSLVVTGLVAAPAAAAGGYEVVVPYGSDGYRIQEVVQGGGVGFEQPGFDDSAFSDGTAAFGKSGMCADVTTEWTPLTDLLLRRVLPVPDDGRRLHLSLRVVGDVEVFVNGSAVTDGLVPGSDQECPSSVDLLVPEAMLARGADNLIAVRARSMPWGGFLDLQATLVPVPPNDDVADATSVAMPFTDQLSLLAATLEPGEPTDACPPESGGPCTTAWYRLTPEASGPVLVDAVIPADEEDLHLGVAVYRGAPLGSLELVALRPYWTWHPLVANLESGVDYLIQVSGSSTLTFHGGEATVTITEAPPVGVDFEYWPATDIKTADRVTFWSNVNDPAGQEVSEWSWTFGDGTGSSESNPSHYFKSGGTFDVTLTVTMTDGRTASTTKPIEVTKAELVPPDASFTFQPEAPDTTTDVWFYSGSNDPANVGIERWSWDFGDGATGDWEWTSHRYAVGGDYTVTLEIETFDGRIATASQTVRVTQWQPPDPTPSFWVSPNPAYLGTAMQFTDSTWDLYSTVTAVGWDFGDGTTDSGSIVSHTYAADGTYTVTMSATMADGRTGATSQEVTVLPTPPPEVYINYYPWDPSSFDTIQFNANAWDPAGIGLDSYDWDFGDGAGSPDPYPAHQYPGDGTYHVTLTVTTPDGRSATAEMDIVVATHDVAITRLTAAKSASSGQTKAISADIVSRRSTETVTVQLFRGTTQGYVFAGEQVVEVRKGRTARVSFDYLFTPEDATLGKVTFKLVALLPGLRDALPADNEAITTPIKITK